jgi:hypothetical protein
MKETVDEAPAAVHSGRQRHPGSSPDKPAKRAEPGISASGKAHLGMPGTRTRWLSIVALRDAGVRCRVRCVVMSARVARRAGVRGVDRGEDSEMPVETRDRQDEGYLWRRRGQAQPSR